MEVNECARENETGMMQGMEWNGMGWMRSNVNVREAMQEMKHYDQRSRHDATSIKYHVVRYVA